MKKIFTLFCAFALAIGASAQLKHQPVQQRNAVAPAMKQELVASQQTERVSTAQLAGIEASGQSKSATRNGLQLTAKRTGSSNASIQQQPAMQNLPGFRTNQSASQPERKAVKLNSAKSKGEKPMQIVKLKSASVSPAPTKPAQASGDEYDITDATYQETDYGIDLYIAIMDNATGNKFYFDVFYPEGKSELEAGVTYTLEDMDTEYTFGKVSNKSYEPSAANYSFTVDEKETKTVTASMTLTTGDTYNFNIVIEKYIPGVYEISAVDYSEKNYGTDQYIGMISESGQLFYFDIYVSELESGKTYELADMDPTYSVYSADGKTAVGFTEADFTKTVNQDGTFSVLAHATTKQGDVFTITYSGTSYVPQQYDITAASYDEEYYSYSGDWYISMISEEGEEFYFDIYTDNLISGTTYGFEDMDDQYSCYSKDGVSYYGFSTADFTKTVNQDGSFTVLAHATALSNGDKYTITYTEAAPTPIEKTREETITVNNAEFQDYTAAGFFRILGTNEDKTRDIVLYFVGKNIVGDFSIEDETMDKYNSWVSYLQDKEVTANYYPISSNFNISINEQGDTVVSGTMLAPHSTDETDIPEFTITMVMPHQEEQWTEIGESAVTDRVVSYILGDVSDAAAYNVETMQKGSLYQFVNLFGSKNPAYQDIKTGTGNGSYTKTNIEVDATDPDNVTIARQKIGWKDGFMKDYYYLTATKGKLADGTITFEAANCLLDEDGEPFKTPIGGLTFVLPNQGPSKELITPPAGLETTEMNYTASGMYEDYTGTVLVGWDNNDVYIQGICVDLPTAWIKGTLNSGVVTFDKFEYIGEAYGLPIWMIGCDDDGNLVEFKMTYNAGTNTFNSANLLVENASTEELYYLDAFNPVVISPKGTIVPLKYDATDADFAADFANDDIKISMVNTVASVSATNSDNETAIIEMYIPAGSSKIPAGEYTVSDTKGENTILASQGVVGSSVTSSFAGKRNAQGQITTPIWFIVEGKATVSYDDDIMTMEIAAKNSNGRSIDVTITKQVTEQPSTELITPPEGLVTAEMPFTAAGTDDDFEGTVLVGWDNNDVYIQGLCVDFPTAWIKGTLNDGVVTFKKFQYIGAYGGSMPIWTVGTNAKSEMVEFTMKYDEEANMFTANNILVENASYEKIYYLEKLSKIVIGEVAEPEWGEWEDFAPFGFNTGTWTFTVMSSKPSPYSGYQALVRTDKNNADNKQIKITNWGEGWFGEGVEIIMNWNAKTNTCYIDKQFTGYNHSTYGKVYVSSVEDGSYDPETGTFSNMLTYTVSAGSFGSGIETYVMDTKQPGLMYDEQEIPFDAKFAWTDMSTSIVDGVVNINATNDAKQTISLALFIPEEATEIPAGEYVISDSQEEGTALKSLGVVGGYLTDCFAGTRGSSGIENCWFMVDGTITIAYDEFGKMVVTVVAKNSYDVDINATVKYEKIEPKGTATIEANTLQIYDDYAELYGIYEYYAENETYGIDLYAYSKTPEGTFDETNIDFGDCVIYDAEGNKFGVFEGEFTVTVNGKNSTLTGSVLGKDTILYELNLKGFQGAIPGDAQEAFTATYSTEDISDVFSSKAKMHVLSACDEAGDSIHIVFKSSQDPLEARTYEITTSGSMNTVIASDGTATSLNAVSFAAKKNDGEIDQLWHMVSGTVVIGEDGSITVNALNSYDQAITINVNVPLPDYYLQNYSNELYLGWNGSSTDQNKIAMMEEADRMAVALTLTDAEKKQFTVSVTATDEKPMYLSLGTGFNFKTYADSGEQGHGYLYEIEDINKSQLVANKVSEPTEGNFYLIVYGYQGSYSALGGKVTDTSGSGKMRILGYTLKSADDQLTVAFSDIQDYIYRYVTATTPAPEPRPTEEPVVEGNILDEESFNFNGGTVGQWKSAGTKDADLSAVAPGYNNSAYAMKVTTATSGAIYDTQAKYVGQYIKGHTYSYSFKAKASQNVNMQVALQQDGGDYLGDYSMPIALTTEWAEYSGKLTVSNDGYVRFLLNVGETAADYFFDQIVLIDETATSVMPLMMNNDDAIYTVSGQRVIEPVKGEIYIINGQQTLFE